MQAHKAPRKTHKSTSTLLGQDQTHGSLPSAASAPKTAEASLLGGVIQVYPSQSPSQVSNTSLWNVKIGSGHFGSCKFFTIPNHHHKFQILPFEMSKLAVWHFGSCKAGTAPRKRTATPVWHPSACQAVNCQFLVALWMNKCDTLGWSQASRYRCKGHRVPLQIKICSSKPKCSILIYLVPH